MKNYKCLNTETGRMFIATEIALKHLHNSKKTTNKTEVLFECDEKGNKIEVHSYKEPEIVIIQDEVIPEPEAIEEEIKVEDLKAEEEIFVNSEEIQAEAEKTEPEEIIAPEPENEQIQEEIKEEVKAPITEAVKTSKKNSKTK